ncbi:MAG: restriction endonuclease subunit S [Candidatus Saccharimonadales bacterium]
MMKTLRLGDVCEIVNGGTPKTGVAEYWDGDVLWITPKDLGKVTTRTTAHTERKLSRLGVQNSSAKIIPAHSVVLSTRAPIGHVAVNTEPMAFNQGCRGLIPSKKLLVEYLYYFLKYSKEKLNELGTGTTFRELSAGVLKDVEIPLSSLDEQRRVVERLDAAFERIDRAIELTEKNIENVWHLHEKILVDIFDNMTTNTVPLADVYDVRDGTHDSPRYHQDGFPLITSKNLKSGSLSFEKLNYIKRSDYDKINERSKVDKGDVLMAMIGTIGNPIVIDDEPEFAIKNVALFKPLKGQNSTFLKYYLMSGGVTRKMQADARGTTQKFVSLGYLRNFPFPSVRPSIQNAVVKNLDCLNKQVVATSGRYRARINLYTDLKQSLLTQAFSGDGVK